MSALPQGRFGCILADPPWQFRTYDKKRSVPGRAATDPYSTMSRAELQALPVASVAAPDCALFMWIVGAHIPEGLALAESWGFTFKTDVLFWDKGQIGMGYWSRKEGEQCFLFTQGKPPRLAKNVRQIIRAPRREHSRKPEEQYARIEALVGGPYLELFARAPRAGWTTWGDQAKKFEAAA